MSLSTKMGNCMQAYTQLQDVQNGAVCLGARQATKTE